MLHVVFSSSGAGSLRQALIAQGLRQRVVDLTDNLDWGPIATNSFDDRQAWLDSNIPLQESGWDWIANSARKFEEKIRSDPDRLIWIAPQSASELCAFYWYLDLIGGTGARMIVVDYPLLDAWRGMPPQGLGQLHADRFSDLLNSAERQPWNPIRFPANRWKVLRTEASLLRTVNGDLLNSVREDYFDEQLLANCSDKWQKCYRIVGETMVSMWEQNHHADDMFLSWRLRVLAEQKRIESNREIVGHAMSRTDPLLIRLAC
jgi:Protein of unknown function/Domain of unknown function (DUF1835)